MIKNRIIKASSVALIFSGFMLLFLFACKKNDINVIDADLNGTTSGGTSTTGTSGSTSTTFGSSTTGGTTTGCNPVLNSVTFSTNMFNNFSNMSGSPVTWNSYYTLYTSITVGGYLRTVRISLPMSSAPSTSSTYTVDYSYFTNGYVLSPGKCGVRFYEAVSGTTDYGYGLSGTVTVTVSGTYVVAQFCNMTFKAYSGSSYINNYVATGKISS